MSNKPEECIHDFISGSVFWFICIRCSLMVEKVPSESGMGAAGLGLTGEGVGMMGYPEGYLPKNIPPEYAKHNK